MALRHPGVHVEAVHLSDSHSFSKRAVSEVELIAGLGIQGDTHQGTSVQHRSRIAIDPSRPNLRQVHLLGSELFQDVAKRGYTVGPGDLGENITTIGIDLLALPTGTTLRLGSDCLISITGLRNPCQQINDFRDGLLSEMLERNDDGTLVKKAGVMAVVIRSGVVRPGDSIDDSLPPLPHIPLTGV